MKKFVSRCRKANDCALQHIETFREQALAGAVADFGEPCQRCIHRHSCDLDWLSTLLPLLSHADVKIKMGV